VKLWPWIIRGIPRFQLLQQWQKCPTAPLVLLSVRLLWNNGWDITGAPVLQRRVLLGQIVSPVNGIQVGSWIPGRGKDLFRSALETGFEGIVAKRKASTYQPGQRSKDWLKIKCQPQQEFVVGGFTEGKGSRQMSFGALLLGAYRNGKLHYFGHSGTGFSKRALQDALDRMRPLATSNSRFVNPPRPAERVQWIKPELVCEVAFAEWTDDEQLRQTTFLGWRDDRNPEEVVLERPDSK
jgi:bifunctional non-homologous end joining protein LigD